MNNKFLHLATLCSFTALAVPSLASARGIRADAPCPYSGGVNAWNVDTKSPSSPYNPGGTPTSNYAVLTENGGSDDVGLSVISGTMYNWYAAPVPPATDCNPSNEFSNPANVPVINEQVIVYKLSSDDALGSTSLPSGLTEVEFNYGGPTAGNASFTIGQVTYESTSSLGSTDDQGAQRYGNDFLFYAGTNELYGSISNDGTSVDVKDLPKGWSASQTTVSAPEIDAASAVSELTLLVGGLSVLVGARRRIECKPLSG